MYPQALSVPDAIREIFANNNIYREALELGIANYTALAEKIKPDIEKLIGTSVNLNTIVVAIKRFADAVGKSSSEHNNKSSIATKARMSLTGSMIDVDFQKERDNGDNDTLSKNLDDCFEQENPY